VSLAQSEVEPSADAEPRRWRAGSRAQWLILGCYLLGAIGLTCELWADPASHAQADNPADIAQFAFWMRYAATAVSHGHLPALVTTAMNAPHGINLMWNGAPLLPAVLLTPVTLLAGPQASLDIMLTLGFAGSAASMFLVLRRWQASIPAAALAAAVYGFSPALLGAAIGHYHLQFAVLPPLIIDAALGVVTGRGNRVRAGLWLGLLTAAQLFIGEELLVDTALAGLLIVAVLAAGQPRAVLGRARAAAPGLAIAVGVALLVCGRALWVQFRGPLTEHGSPWPTTIYANRLADFVTPPRTLLFHTQASVHAVASQPLIQPEYVAYLGWPLIVVLLAAAIRYWRDRKILILAVTWAVLEFFSLGSHPFEFLGLSYPVALLPWHYLRSLPMLGQVLPSRLPILADGAAAALLAFSVDRVRSAVPLAWSQHWQKKSLPFAVAALAVLPLLPLPMHRASLPAVPAGWQAAFARLQLPAGAPVLVVPIPYQQSPDAMRWQADTGEPGSLIGGWFVGPDQTGHARAYGKSLASLVQRPLDELWHGPANYSPLPPAAAIPPSAALMRADLASWRPAAVIAVTSPGSRLGRFLTGLLGPPAFQIGSVLAWRRLEPHTLLTRRVPGAHILLARRVPGPHVLLAGIRPDMPGCPGACAAS
jgi:hypothetical protein